MKSRLLALAATAPCALLPLPAAGGGAGPRWSRPTRDIAAATYSDSLATAKDLQAAVRRARSPARPKPTLQARARRLAGRARALSAVRGLPLRQRRSSTTGKAG
ncbi:MAG: hypothetical protein MZV49_19600 [Rhodopseudomonas palustris]|nr:hypothetical protein [Rhodopseudomonas palustris]